MIESNFKKVKVLMHLAGAYQSKTSLSKHIDSLELLDRVNVEDYGVCNYLQHGKFIDIYALSSNQRENFLNTLGLKRKTSERLNSWYNNFDERRDDIFKSLTNKYLFYIKQDYDLWHLSNKEILMMQLEILTKLEQIYFSEETLSYFAENTILSNFYDINTLGICLVLGNLQSFTRSILEKEISISFLGLEYQLEYSKDEHSPINYMHWWNSRDERLQVIRKHINFVKVCIKRM